MSCISENKNLIFKILKFKSVDISQYFGGVFLTMKKKPLLYLSSFFECIMHFQARFSQIEKMRLLLYTSNMLNGQVFLH